MSTMELKDIVEQRLEQLGKTAMQVTAQHGVERTFLRDIVEGRKKSVRGDNLPKLARILELDIAALSRGKLVPVDEAAPDERPATREVEHNVRVMGYIGAGAEIEPDFEQVPPEGLKQLSLPFPLPDGLIAFEVKGESMLPFYKDGHAVIVWEDQKRPLEYFYGEDAVVRTSAGRRYIKTIERGFNGVNLRSFNAPLIEDVHLEWVGEIFAVMPRSQLKNLEKKGGVQGQFNRLTAQGA